MITPYHATISSTIPRTAHRELHALIALAAELHPNSAQLAEPLATATELHIKQGSRVYGQTSGHAYYTRNGLPWSDPTNQALRAGDRYALKVQPGVKYLVTIKLQPGLIEMPNRQGYGYYERFGSRQIHYWRYKTAPTTTLHTWQEEVLYLIAHEYTHIYQSAHGAQHSELHYIKGPDDKPLAAPKSRVWAVVR